MGKKRKLDAQETTDSQVDPTMNSGAATNFSCNDSLGQRSGGASSAINTTEHVSFNDLGLDSRLLQAIERQKFTLPTLVQLKTIPLALQGKDLLVRAKTGSGKTAAYVLPLIQSIIKSKSLGTPGSSTSALILVPTRELANQVTKATNALCMFCQKDVIAVDLTSQANLQAQRAMLSSLPDIVVATPSRANTHLQDTSLRIENLTHLVIDEADLVLSYEYGEDFDKIVPYVPRGVQTLLASATLTAEVDILKRLFCPSPTILDLQEDEEQQTTDALHQYVVWCEEEEKFLLAFALFKLKLVKGKCIIFVANVDRSYRIKLFLEQFGVKSCVMNSELPANCRIHVVEEFNRGVYDIIIAADEMETVNASTEVEQSREMDTERTSRHVDTAEEETKDLHSGESMIIQKKSKQTAVKRGEPKKDLAYGISRGIDFNAVACVLNFDLPNSAKSYSHRIGRTARAGRTGLALSFATHRSHYGRHHRMSHGRGEDDVAIMSKITRDQSKNGASLRPYRFDMEKLNGFKYRITSALKVVTPGAVRDARIKEIRAEMLRSNRLKRHLEENPADLEFLRHDGELRPKKVLTHLRHVPEYLLPSTIANDLTKAGGHVSNSARSNSTEEPRQLSGRRTGSLKSRIKSQRNGRRDRSQKRGLNPLKTLSAG